MKLLFVYNADSGLLNGLSDLLHKVISPSTYGCNLCAVTYDFTGMRKEWRDFVDRLPAEVRFLHRDELGDQRPDDVDLPAVFRQMPGGSLDVWIDATTLNEVGSIEELVSLVRNRLDATGRPANS